MPASAVVERLRVVAEAASVPPLGADTQSSVDGLCAGGFSLVDVESERGG